MISLSEIRGPLPRVLSPVNTTSSWDSEMSVVTGLVASFAKPWPFLRSSRLRLGWGLTRCSSASSYGAFDCVGGVGERRREGGAGECRRGGADGERYAGVVHSSSHVDVARSSSRHLLGLGGGAGRVRGGYSMVRYWWMMDCSFFPS